MRLVCGVNYVVSFLVSVVVLSRPMSLVLCGFGVGVVYVSTLSVLVELFWATNILFSTNNDSF